MSSEREKKLWFEFNFFNNLSVSLALVLIVIGYFLIGYFWKPTDQFGQLARDLILNVIENTVPVFLAILVSFFLYSRIQQLKSEAEIEGLSKAVASRVKREIREELRISFEDSVKDSVTSSPDLNRKVIKEFETTSKVTKTKRNHRLIDSSFIGWQQATIMLWVRIPPKGQGLRNAPDYRYLFGTPNQSNRKA